MALHVGLVVDLSNGFANHYMYTYVLGLDHYYGTPGIWIPKLLGIAQLGVWLNPHMTSR
jgi:hypothetical protein